MPDPDLAQAIIAKEAEIAARNAALDAEYQQRAADWEADLRANGLTDAQVALAKRHSKQSPRIVMERQSRLEPLYRELESLRRRHAQQAEATPEPEATDGS